MATIQEFPDAPAAIHEFPDIQEFPDPVVEDTRQITQRWAAEKAADRNRAARGNVSTIAGGQPLSLPGSSQTLAEELLPETGPVAAVADKVSQVWTKINTPLVHETAPLDPEEIARQSSRMQNHPTVQTAGGVMTVRREPDELSVSVPPAKRTFASGVVDATDDLAHSFTSPLGVATLGMGALPKTAQKAVSLAFATQMVSQMPSHAAALREEFQKPADQRDNAKIGKLVTEAAANLGFATLAARHGLSGDQTAAPNSEQPAQNGEQPGDPGEQVIRPDTNPSPGSGPTDAVADLKKTLSTPFKAEKPAPQAATATEMPAPAPAPRPEHPAVAAVNKLSSAVDELKQALGHEKPVTQGEIAPKEQEIPKTGTIVPEQPAKDVTELTKTTPDATTVAGAAAETTTGQNERTGSEVPEATISAPEPMPAEGEAAKPTIPQTPRPTSKTGKNPFWLRPRSDGVPDILDSIQSNAGEARRRSWPGHDSCRVAFDRCAWDKPHRDF
jgi:hypothetical protein